MENKDDCWSNRNTGMCCATCMWFAQKGKQQEGRMLFGRCRRHCPTMSGYPAVWGADWCGDHKLDENKV